ncbi:MAG: cytochrome P450, partial [Bacteroidetes bacterium]|nr:cytochrome P450 [Bacteroidota bacterium]
TIALLNDGYNFIRKHCEEHKSDLFKTRLMGKPVICMTGREAAEIFYDNSKFIRRGATPKRIQNTLFGEKGVQTLDDEAHLSRKDMFMSLMNPSQLNRFSQLIYDQWNETSPRWEYQDQIILLEESQEIMCRVACKWAGVPVYENEVHQRSFEFGAMVDAFGAAGTRHRKGKIARESTEKWIRKIVTQTREGKIQVPPGTAAHVFSLELHSGKLLDPKIASVEIINILRPIVAVGTYIAFAALALHHYPACKKRIQDGDDQFAEWFAQEVRRYYPFTPFVGARVRTGFEWNGFKFPAKRLVLLDVYGINHDSHLWEKPEDFIPERFENRKTDPFNFIPQGGGDHYTGHRCAGEWITIIAITEAVKFLSRNLQYEVPEQDLRVDLTRMPTAPQSHFIISKVLVKERVGELA